jgi:hypothetical protein
MRTSASVNALRTNNGLFISNDMASNHPFSTNMPDLKSSHDVYELKILQCLLNFGLTPFVYLDNILLEAVKKDCISIVDLLIQWSRKREGQVGVSADYPFRTRFDILVKQMFEQARINGNSTMMHYLATNSGVELSQC